MPVQIAGTINDPGDDRLLGTIDFGDGVIAPIIIEPDGSFSTQHIYAQNGTFNVTVSVQDEDAGDQTVTFDAMVDNAQPSVDAGFDATVLRDQLFSRNLVMHFALVVVGRSLSTNGRGSHQHR